MRRSFVNEEEIGRIVDKRHFDTICKFYDDSVSSIAEVIIGGRDKFREDIRFIPPTVLRMRDTTCPLMTEELFSRRSSPCTPWIPTATRWSCATHARSLSPCALCLIL